MTDARKKTSVSIRTTCFDKLVERAKAIGIPHSAIVEILIARELGIPIDELPHLGEWVDKLDAVQKAAG